MIRIKENGIKETVIQLGQQSNFWLCDAYPEFLNMNREKHETLLSYVSRVYTSNSMRDTNCLGISECIPA